MATSSGMRTSMIVGASSVPTRRESCCGDIWVNEDMSVHPDEPRIMDAIVGLTPHGVVAITPLPASNHGDRPSARIRLARGPVQFPVGSKAEAHSRLPAHSACLAT